MNHPVIISELAAAHRRDLLARADRFPRTRRVRRFTRRRHAAEDSA